jgi:hypothetical protein
VYEVKLIYKDFKQHKPSLTYCENLTFAATVDLFLRGIHTVQTSATRIGFESDRDRMLGLLYLSGKEQYTPVYAEYCDRAD